MKANADCSIVASTQNLKIRNIQTLINTHPNYYQKEHSDQKELAVEVIKEDYKNQVVEIRIEKELEERKKAQRATFVCKKMRE